MSRSEEREQGLDIDVPTPPSKRILSWQNIRDIAVIALIVVIGWKLALAPWNVNIERFSFTDLLALILALFSVWLSVLFYFKADEGSKRFYDDSYRFTKDISVLLGRIEERFGEQLTSLKDHYGGLRQDLQARAVVVEEKKEELNQASGAVLQVVKDLVQADVSEPNQSAALIEQLREKERELDKAQQDLERAQDALSKARRYPLSTRTKNLMALITKKLVGEVYGSWGPAGVAALRNSSELQERFTVIFNELSPSAKNLLIDDYMVERDGKLTVLGLGQIWLIQKDFEDRKPK